MRAREPGAGALALLLNLPAGLVLLLVLAWPVAYAGWLSLHEVSLRQLRTGDLPWAGLANRVAARVARRIAITHEASATGFPEERVAVTGNPPRAGLGRR